MLGWDVAPGTASGGGEAEVAGFGEFEFGFQVVVSPFHGADDLVFEFGEVADGFDIVAVRNVFEDGDKIAIFAGIDFSIHEGGHAGFGKDEIFDAGGGGFALEIEGDGVVGGVVLIHRGFDLGDAEGFAEDSSSDEDAGVAAVGDDFGVGVGANFDFTAFEVEGDEFAFGGDIEAVLAEMVLEVPGELGLHAEEDLSEGAGAAFEGCELDKSNADKASVIGIDAFKSTFE